MKTTEQELISKLQLLKEVKPRENWVAFVKTQVLSGSPAEQNISKPSFAEVFGNIFKAAFERKLAYSAAVLLLVITAGAFIFMKGILPGGTVLNLGQNSTASLAAAKSNVEELKTKSRILSDLVSHNPKDVSSAAKEVKDAAQKLTEEIQKNPHLAKAVALEVNNNKTYLEIAGGNDLKETSDVLYKTIVEQMIKDLENTTLAEGQQESLGIVKNLYEEKEYASALESILLLDIAIKGSN